jgi:hypothetical protein
MNSLASPVLALRDIFKMRFRIEAHGWLINRPPWPQNDAALMTSIFEPANIDGCKPLKTND